MTTQPTGTPGTGWLSGAAAAMVLSFDVDAESCVLAEGSRYVTHIGALSHQAYGPRVGVPRILDLLAEFGVRATFFVPGRSAEGWPDVVERIAAAGHEIAHHSYAHEKLVLMSRDEERRDFERGLRALERLGVHPVGHRSPLSSPSVRTAALLAEHGFRYQSTLMDDDRPYLIDTPSGRIAELPPHWLTDDFPQYAFLPDPRLGQAVESPRRALEVWSLELAAMRRYGCLFVLCAHPFLSGRPSRVEALRELIGTAIDYGDVAILTAAEVAERVHADPAVDVRPEPIGYAAREESTHWARETGSD
ncbi:polysaccharide deacetylase family protein [Thermoactinospora rubra]|uniref:polysaccharide deacetylase family protein n=1 Tax=Thermoactinospora rubra TaxID=1088767 RepID=UPI000A0F8499|nr:polysaccharide deacetylase [Thermoactinospora rubra]